MSKVGFIGLGKLGLPVAEAMAKADHIVKGYDIATVKSDLIRQPGSLRETIMDTDFIFIAVPTPHDSRFSGSLPIPGDTSDFNYDAVSSVLKEISNELESNKI